MAAAAIAKRNDTAETRRPQAAIPRQAWTTDRWARILGGGSIGLCLLAWFLEMGEMAPLILAALLSGWTVVSALVGWCPIHECLKALGVPDREEVWVRSLGTPVNPPLSTNPAKSTGRAVRLGCWNPTPST